MVIATFHYSNSSSKKSNGKSPLLHQYTVRFSWIRKLRYCLYAEDSNASKGLFMRTIEYRLSRFSTVDNSRLSSCKCWVTKKVQRVFTAINTCSIRRHSSELQLQVESASARENTMIDQGTAHQLRTASILATIKSDSTRNLDSRIATK